MECFRLAQSPGRNVRRGMPASPPRRVTAAPQADESASAESVGTLAGASGATAAAPRSAAARRAARPAPPGVPIVYKILGLLLLAAGIGLAVGYAPFMRWWYGRALNSAAT